MVVGRPLEESDLVVRAQRGDASAYDTTNQVAAAADYAVDTGAIS